MKKYLVALALVAALGAASPAAATSVILNIDAKSTAGVDYAFAEGTTYRLELIGVAQGGAYDGWNPTGITTCRAVDTCTAREGWWNAFSVKGQFETAYTSYFLRKTLGTGPVAYFATAQASLAAYRAVTQIDALDANGPYIEAYPFVFAIPAQTANFRIAEVNSGLADNLGGVSLRVTSVPEPGAWALMLSGFGLAGLAIRRRRVQTGATAT